MSNLRLRNISTSPQSAVGKKKIDYFITMNHDLEDVQVVNIESFLREVLISNDVSVPKDENPSILKHECASVSKDENSLVSEKQSSPVLKDDSSPSASTDENRSTSKNEHPTISKDENPQGSNDNNDNKPDSVLDYDPIRGILSITRIFSPLEKDLLKHIENLKTNFRQLESSFNKLYEIPATEEE